MGSQERQQGPFECVVGLSTPWLIEHACREGFCLGDHGCHWWIVAVGRGLWCGRVVSGFRFSPRIANALFCPLVCVSVVVVVIRGSMSVRGSTTDQGIVMVCVLGREKRRTT